MTNDRYVGVFDVGGKMERRPQLDFDDRKVPSNCIKLSGTRRSIFTFATKELFSEKTKPAPKIKPY